MFGSCVMPQRKANLSWKVEIDYQGLYRWYILMNYRKEVQLKIIVNSMVYVYFLIEQPGDL